MYVGEIFIYVFYYSYVCRHQHVRGGDGEEKNCPWCYKNYKLGGKMECTYGAMCVYSHGNQKLTNEQQVQRCIAFSTKGECQYGDACLLAHELGGFTKEILGLYFIFYYKITEFRF